MKVVPTLFRATGASGVNPGLIFMILAMFLLPAGDTLAKLLTSVMSPLEVAMWRLLAQALWLVPFALLLRTRLSGTMFSPIVALSGGLFMVALTCLISAFSVMPIATAIAIFFVEPLLLTLLAGPFLGEKIGPRRLVAVGVGLVGTLIVVRPGFSQFGPMTVLPLIAATAYAFNMIVLRHACRTRSALTVQCGATIYAAVGLILLISLLHVAGSLEFAAPHRQGWTWLAILAAGGLAASSFVLIAEASRRVEAGALAPFQYLEIFGATLVGYLVFDDLPDTLTWVGITLILTAGLYVFHRERKQVEPVPKRRRADR